MEDLCDTAGWRIPPGGFSLFPLNSPAALLHWRALAFLLGKLSSDQQDELRTRYAELGKQRPNRQRRLHKAVAQKSQRYQRTAGDRQQRSVSRETVEPVKGSAGKAAQSPCPVPSTSREQQEKHETPHNLSGQRLTVTTVGGDVVPLMSLTELQQHMNQPLILKMGYLEPTPTKMISSPPESNKDHSPMETGSPVIVLDLVGQEGERHTSLTGSLTNSPVLDLDYMGTPSTGHSGRMLSTPSSPILTVTEEDHLLADPGPRTPIPTASVSPLHIMEHSVSISPVAAPVVGRLEVPRTSRGLLHRGPQW